MGDAAVKEKTIALSGSVDIIREFFEYAINSILYQRGIYPPEDFKRAPKYGLTMMVASDAKLQEYLGQVMSQLESWLKTGEVQRLVVVVTGADSGATLERWAFAVNATPEADENAPNGNATPTAAGAKQKTPKEVQQEIQAIIRQITASVTFLPLLEEACTFDLLIYTRKSATVPVTWEDSDPKYISNATEVKLRSFTTSVHQIDAAVSYKDDDAV